MIFTEPKVYLIAQTKINKDSINDYLSDIGNPDWKINPSESDGESLIEIGGRMCYRSWQKYDPSKPLCTNPNVTKVREGNKEYIRNVLNQKHGSIFEHVSATFILRDVSRIVTHEIVRHRAGMSFSQESLRYVRLDNLRFFMPKALSGNKTAIKKVEEVVSFLEQVQVDLSDIFDIDNIKDFHTKKQLTSAFRRLAPEGLLTSIMVTGNLRAWRHMIEIRTSEAAEEEIRVVFSKISDILKKEYPNVFQDMSVNQNGEYKFENSKV